MATIIVFTMVIIVIVTMVIILIITMIIFMRTTGATSSYQVMSPWIEGNCGMEEAEGSLTDIVTSLRGEIFTSITVQMVSYVCVYVYQREAAKSLESTFGAEAYAVNDMTV